MELARIVDQRMNEIAQQSKGISALKIAILAALNIADEFLKQQETEKVLADKGGRLISLLDGVVHDV